MLVLATDLDGTFLGGSLGDRNLLYQWIRSNRAQIVLVFVTGRALENVTSLLEDGALPWPDYIVCDVGASVVDGRTMQSLQPLDDELGALWKGEAIVLDALPAEFKLERQQQQQHRRCSFYTSDSAAVAAVRDAVASIGCVALHSANRYLDILPAGVSKGATLSRLIRQAKLDPATVLVAGDTLNDASMFTATQFRGVVVGGAEPALRTLTAQLPNTYHSKAEGAGGILEAIAALGCLRNSGVRSRPAGEAELVVVYHRQPFDDEPIAGSAAAATRPNSPNGIIPTLLGLFRDGRKGAWVAWSKAGADPSPLLRAREYRNLIVSRLLLTRDDVDLFYQKFSKEALWPVLHSFVERARFDHRHWQHYLDINQRFALQAAGQADCNALVWIHDYNLWLVPHYLREMRPDLRIAFFHHTPFPATDIFNVLPWSAEIVASLLQCDYVGFQIPRYAENFAATASSHFDLDVARTRIAASRFVSFGTALGAVESSISLERNGTVTRLGVHPVGLDLKRIAATLRLPDTRAAICRLQGTFSGQVVVLCAERLDYSKGALQKALAFEQLLALYPAWREKITFIYVCAPPAGGISVYDEIKQQVEQAVGRINGRFSTSEWTPMSYMARCMPFDELAAYLAVTDVAWVTPLRDGLNLMAKEYVAVTGALGRSGTLIVSAFAGCSVELKGAVLTNPYDVSEMAATLQRVLGMSDDERHERMRTLQEIVTEYDVEHWARHFIHCASPAHAKPATERQGFANPLTSAAIAVRRGCPQR